MLLVHGAVDDRVRKFRHCGERVGIFKAVFLRKAEHFLRFLAANGVRVCHADDFQHFGIGQCQFCVDNRAVPRADNHGGNRFLRHNLSTRFQIFP